MLAAGQAIQPALPVLHAFAELRQGRPATSWIDDAEAMKIANDVLDRIAQGITTKIEEVDDGELPFIIRPEDAITARVSLQTVPELPDSEKKSQIGSIEGVLTDITTHYRRPAIKVVERKSGREVRCLIPEELTGMFSDKTKAKDVWTHRRVVVRGLIHYDSSGEIREISATSIDSKETREVSLEEIADRNFTNGLSISEYLEKLRDGELD